MAGHVAVIFGNQPQNTPAIHAGRIVESLTSSGPLVAGRLPARIAIDPGQPPAARLAPGMSVVSVDTARPATDGAVARRQAAVLSAP